MQTLCRKSSMGDNSLITTIPSSPTTSPEPAALILAGETLLPLLDEEKLQPGLLEGKEYHFINPNI